MHRVNCAPEFSSHTKSRVISARTIGPAARVDMAGSVFSALGFLGVSRRQGVLGACLRSFWILVGVSRDHERQCHQGGRVSRQRRYPSDLTDGQRALIESLLSAPRTGGRPEKHPRRSIVDGILHALRTGCAWRYLPAGFRRGRPCTGISSNGSRPGCRRSGRSRTCGSAGPPAPASGRSGTTRHRPEVSPGPSSTAAVDEAMRILLDGVTGTQ